MPTFSTLADFLSSPITRKIYLVEVTGKRRSGTAGVESITRYYSTEDIATLPTDSPANREYKGIVRGLPRIKRSMQSILTSGDYSESFPSYGSLLLSNHVKELDGDWGVGGYSPDGWALRVEIAGDPDALAFSNRGGVLVGVGGENYTISDFEMDLPILDNAGEVDKFGATGTTEGSEFANLPDGNRGVTKPEIWGEVRNLKPILVDTVNLTYLVAAHVCHDILSVYSNAVPLSEVYGYIPDESNANGARFDLVNNPNNAEITCDVMGYKMQQTGVFSHKLGDIIEDVVLRKTALTVSNFDSAALTRFKSDSPYDTGAPFDVGIAVTRPTKVRDVIRQLLSGIPSLTTIDRNGKFVLSAFYPPVGPADLTFSDDIEILGESPITVLRPIQSAMIGYDNVEFTQDGGRLATSVTPARAAHLAREFRVASISSSVTDVHPLASSRGPIQSRLLNRTDAVDVASRHADLFGVKRYLVKARFKVQPLSVSLNAVVDFKRDRLGLNPSGSNLWRVVDIEEELGRQQSTVTLGLWQ